MQQYKNGFRKLRAVAIRAAGKDEKGRGRKTRTTRQNEGIYRLRRAVFAPAGGPRRDEAKRDCKDRRTSDGIHWTIRGTRTRTPPGYLPISGLRLHLLLRICPPIRLLDRPDPAPSGNRVCLGQGAIPVQGFRSPVAVFSQDHRPGST
jgi:hypothetical protein